MKVLRGSTAFNWNALDTRNVLVWAATTGVGWVLAVGGVSVPEHVQQAWVALWTAPRLRP